MSEGGTLPWKVQGIDTSRGPPTSYANLDKPLPTPPKGQIWSFNEDTREWKLVDIESLSADTPSEVTGGDADETNEKGEAEVQKDPNTFGEPSVETPADADIIIHKVEPTDTFQGICLRYHISPTELRRANHFSGSSLLSAPSTLKIPVDPATLTYQSQMTREEQISNVVAAIGGNISRSEAKAYLSLNDWNLPEAIENAKSDLL
jgi:LysM repeat protein